MQDDASAEDAIEPVVQLNAPENEAATEPESTPPMTVVPPSGTITCVDMLCVLIAGEAPPTMVAVELFSAKTVRMTVP